MMEAKEKKHEEENSHTFKRLVSHNPPVHDGVTDPKAFEDWIRVMKKLSDSLKCPEE